MLYRSQLETPYGIMHIAVNEAGVLLEVCLPNRGRGALTTAPFPTTALAATIPAQLEEYFRRERRASNLNQAHGAIRKNVWAKLRDSYGTTTSYGAVLLGLSTAHAIGRANGANQSIIIPVIA